MRILLYIGAVAWLIIFAGFIMLGLAAGWAMICSVPIMIIVGLIGLWVYRKYRDLFGNKDGLGI